MLQYGERAERIACSAWCMQCVWRTAPVARSARCLKCALRAVHVAGTAPPAKGESEQQETARETSGRMANERKRRHDEERTERVSGERNAVVPEAGEGKGRARRRTKPSSNAERVLWVFARLAPGTGELCGLRAVRAQCGMRAVQEACITQCVKYGVRAERTACSAQCTQ